MKMKYYISKSWDTIKATLIIKFLVLSACFCCREIARDIAQRLRILNALAEDLGSVL